MTTKSQTNKCPAFTSIPCPLHESPIWDNVQAYTKLCYHCNCSTTKRCRPCTKAFASVRNFTHQLLAAVNIKSTCCKNKQHKTRQQVTGLLLYTDWEVIYDFWKSKQSVQLDYYRNLKSHMTHLTSKYHTTAFRNFNIESEHSNETKPSQMKNA